MSASPTSTIARRGNSPAETSRRPARPDHREPEHRAQSGHRGHRLATRILGGYLPLLLAMLIVSLPLLWMVLSSFKSPSEIITTTLSVWPRDPSWENYAEAARSVPFARFFANSVLVTVVGATIKTLLSILTAYALVFIRFPFKNVIFILILVALMVPPQVAVLPNYALIASLGGLNTYWGIIVPGLGTAFGTFLLRQHFSTLPKSMFEAAEIDGAGHWQRLWRMAVPISTPSIATVALVTIVNEWNDYLWPLIITDKPSMMTLPVGLTLLTNTDSGSQNWGVLMAGSVIVILPILIVFTFLQRYVVAGLTQGSVTG
ncbi:carbohydrate ABC transporter permease [Brooklawnia cerclae]|uniref:Sn-glycerol 3-phosphate transport system permease protein n=1 Tax=Brooklawnia cerclae TaxID=349934 RepID=A0ABX0SDJ4_9ACTN|nr:carbohydrate ABC transporter permease [Brooklawnia cerclae]NIH56465.1 sn-glycerol 3-phosphate transport system permease protein [Brooklawnia cerclae]